MGNIALNKTTAASSYVLPFSPNKAVDGNTAPLNRWVCNSVSTAYPGWLTVDMGLPRFVNRWVVKHISAGGFVPSADYSNRDYNFQGSNDNVNWTNIDTVTGNTQSTTDRTTAIVYFRYYRLYVTSGLNANKGLASIEEIEIYEAPLPFLSSLTLSSGTLNPAFSSAVYSYTAGVANDITSITVTATSSGAASTMTINGVATPSGQPSAPISLNVGANTVTVQLTSPGVPVQTYTVVVTRASSPYLTKVEVNYSGRTGSGKNTINMDHTVTSYTTNVPSGSTAATITPFTEDAAAQIIVNGQQLSSGGTSSAISLSASSTQIAIQVKPVDGQTPRDYTVTVIKQ